jgi:hypothetical protein
MGSHVQAIANYAKAVQLDPKNYDASAMLQKLRGRA